MSNRKIAGLALVALATCGAARAQDETARAEALKRAVVQPQAVAARVGQATLDSPVSLPSGIEINADQDSTVLTLKASVRADGGASAYSRFFSFTAKAPLDKDSGRAALGTLKGLGDATSLEVKFTQAQLMGSHLPGDPGGPSMDIARAESDRICRIVDARYKAKNDGEAAPADKLDCEKHRVSPSLVKTYAPEEYDNRMALYFDKSASIFLWGFKGEVGGRTYKYHDATTLAEIEDRKTPWSAGAYVAYELLDARTLFTLRGEHKRTYKEADSKNVCPTPGSTTGCVDGPIGAPTKDDADVVSLEVRKRFGNFGAALTTSYDVGEDSVDIDLPIYLVRDGDKGLTGGVRASWDSKTKDVVFGIFVTQPLSLTGDF